jgi:uncharacterized protein with WD repeat
MKTKKKDLMQLRIKLGTWKTKEIQIRNVGENIENADILDKNEIVKEEIAEGMIMVKESI